MNKQEAQKRIAKLRKVINYHRYLYHVLDKQEISDSALDSLKHELSELEKQFPELITPDSPTQRVGGEPLAEFKKAEHNTPMLSIEDVFTIEELKRWQDYLKRIKPNKYFEYFCELKIDGFAISLIYEKGVLIRAATRGNGLIGEDVTQNIKTIQTIPLRIDIFSEIAPKIKEIIYDGRVEIRGEVYMEKKSFEEINKKRAQKGESQYANPRNLAAGSIRQLDPKLAASRDLKFLGYDIASDTALAMGIEKHSQEHELLVKFGFKAEKGKICNNLEEVEDFWKKAAQDRERLPYQVDGVVVTINDNQLFNELGVAGKSPRGVRAFKFAPKEGTTVVEDIKVQIGRTGAVTPVAVLKPLVIEGATITRATLHNKDQIERLGVKIGDTVIVERAGDVIPAVVKVLKGLRTGKEKSFNFPSVCPICKTKLKKEEVIWRCPNPHCPAIKTEFLEHFVSKKAFDIEGLGGKIVRQLIDKSLISNATDIFSLKEGDLIPLERFAEKSAANLVEEIEKSKNIPLHKFIYALGIRHVGEQTAIDLADKFKNIEALMKADLKDLEAINDIGPKVSHSIYNWLRDKKNVKLISDLKRQGIKIISLPQKNKGQLQGLRFLFTGSLETMSRDEAHQLVRDMGGEPVTSISKKTNYLVVGKNPGQKLKEAKKLGVRVLTEPEFWEMVKAK